jgi:hypothetical protein
MKYHYKLYFESYVVKEGILEADSIEEATIEVQNSYFRAYDEMRVRQISEEEYMSNRPFMDIL